MKTSARRLCEFFAVVALWLLAAVNLVRFTSARLSRRASPGPAVTLEDDAG